MATIYRFVIEQQSGASDNGRKTREPSSNSKGAGKKGRNVSYFGGEKGGVEHNRYTRAINPLLNKVTNGAWEKGMRIGRAAAGLFQKNSATGKFAGLSATAVTIIISFIIQSLLKWQSMEIQKAERLNAQNYKQFENGYSSIHGAYKVSVNMWNGRVNYNENK